MEKEEYIKAVIEDVGDEANPSYYMRKAWMMGQKKLINEIKHELYIELKNTLGKDFVMKYLENKKIEINMS